MAADPVFLFGGGVWVTARWSERLAWLFAGVIAGVWFAVRALPVFYILAALTLMAAWRWDRGRLSTGRLAFALAIVVILATVNVR